MKPRRTPNSTKCYELPGENEDHWLYVQQVAPGYVLSDWELTQIERDLIAAGGRIQLGIMNEPIPPVSLAVVPPFCDSCKSENELVTLASGISEYRCRNIDCPRYDDPPYPEPF